MANPVTVSYGAAAGTAPPALTNSGFISGTQQDDDGGLAQGGTGTSTVAGTYMTITLGGNYSSGVDGSAGLHPEVWPISAEAKNADLYVSGFTGRTITVAAKNAPTASLAANAIQFGYRT